MIGNLLRVTKDELDDYLKDSSLLGDRIYGEETIDTDPNLIGIDKSWDGIIFLLTGRNFWDSDHPLTKVLFSEQLIDKDQDLGYGPAHYLTPNQVIDLSSQLSKVKIEDLKNRFDPKKMTELDIYPFSWEAGDDDFYYLIEYFEKVRQIYLDAASNGQAIITFVN